MLNEEQIERAARNLCELRGIDPDAKVGHGADPSPDGFVSDVWLYSPAWTLAKREVIDHWRINEAIRLALAT